MTLNQRLIHPGRFIGFAIVGVSLVLSACNNGEPPEVTEDTITESTFTSTPLPTETATPTETPAPTMTPIPPKVSFEINPAQTTEAVIGQEFTILLKLDPPVDIAVANWSIVAGGGTIDPKEGDFTIFTAPSEPGAVILQVSGTTVSGAAFDEVIPFQVVAPMPTPTPTQRPTCDNFTAKANNRTSLPWSTLAGEITDPQHCSMGHPTNPQNITVGGSLGEVPEDTFVWILVYAPNGKYYPQCDDALEGRCGVNYAQGKWSVNVFLGRPNCKEHFHLVLVETDNDGNKYLTDTMKSWAETNSYPGITAGEVLALGIRELDSIEVETTGRSCP